MPKVLDQFPKITRPGRNPIHPYDEWFDAASKGEGIQLTRGEDFDADVKTMRHNLYRVAKQRELKVETVTIHDGDSEALGLKVIRPKAKGK